MAVSPKQYSYHTKQLLELIAMQISLSHNLMALNKSHSDCYHYVDYNDCHATPIPPKREFVNDQMHATDKGDCFFIISELVVIVHNLENL